MNEALSALTLETDVEEHDWTTDAEASIHMTSNEGMLINLKPYSGYESVMIGNGTLLCITHTSTATLEKGKNQL